MFVSKRDNKLTGIVMDNSIKVYLNLSFMVSKLAESITDKSLVSRAVEELIVNQDEHLFLSSYKPKDGVRDVKVQSMWEYIVLAYDKYKNDEAFCLYLSKAARAV